ncbi:MAG: ferritin-like domain-containing protein, partial [Kiloniellales bacterium]
DGRIAEVGRALPPLRPARPERPVLWLPRELPRRRIGQGSAGRVALLHALAHIELNAIDLAWDIIARFAAEGLPRAFHDDWLSVAADEARHFTLLDERLAELGANYGDLPAHDGLWQAAEETAHDLLARLAVVPLVLEARGLDVTPAMIAKLRAVGDENSAARLRVIYDDEIGHVAAGKRWFDWLCERRGQAPRQTWQSLVRRHFKGALKPPFNKAGRAAAGLPAAFYESCQTPKSALHSD